jgi:hypothetical protein
LFKGFGPGVIDPTTTVPVPIIPVELDILVPPLATKLCISPLQIVELAGEILIADGKGFTVTVLVAVALEHPPVPVTVYVIVADPAETPETSPVELSTVATTALLEDHVPPELPLEVNVVLPFEHIACVPLKVPADGAVVTVTVLVAEDVLHPPVPVTV